MTHTGTLHDDDDTLGLGFVDVSYSFDYVVDPGDRGCWRTSNGDGWPATPPSVEIERLEIVSVTPSDGGALRVPLTEAWLERVAAWADRVLELDWQSIENEILERESEPTRDD